MLPRRRAIAVALAAVVTGILVALALAGGDDDEPPAEPGTGVQQTQTAPDTETAPPTATVKEQPGPQEVRGIERAVTRLVEASERGDGETVCALLGRDPGGASGVEAAQSCARAARVDLFSLPTSDELSFERVTASGDRGRALLTGGTEISLERTGGGWLVRTLHEPR